MKCEERNRGNGEVNEIPGKTNERQISTFIKIDSINGFKSWLLMIKFIS